jgi:hypothetical protein
MHGVLRAALTAVYFGQRPIVRGDGSTGGGWVGVWVEATLSVIVPVATPRSRTAFTGLENDSGELPLLPTLVTASPIDSAVGFSDCMWEKLTGLRLANVQTPEAPAGSG